MEFFISALYVPLRVALWTALFPWRYVALPLVQVCYGIVRHFLLIPAYLVFRTMVYAFIYVPLKPMLFVANVHYDTLVPVEVTVFRLAARFLPHFQVFLTHFIHYFMISLFMGTFVGAVAGLNISLVGHILSVSEKPNTNKAGTKVDVKIESHVKRPSRIMAEHETKRVKREALQEEKVTKTPEISDEPQTVKSEPRSPLRSRQMPELAEFSSDALFEDDDGYNYVTYQVSDKNEIKKPKKETYTKRREGRYRTVPPSLQSTIQSTIEEESESEITPTPAHSTPTVTATNHLSLDYATGTIGSSKTISTDSSVFSKSLGVTRDSSNGVSREDTDLSGEEDIRKLDVGAAKDSEYMQKYDVGSLEDPEEKPEFGPEISSAETAGNAGTADPDQTYMQDPEFTDGSEASASSGPVSGDNSEK